jgi:hypothetical protein
VGLTLAQNECLWHALHMQVERKVKKFNNLNFFSIVAHGCVIRRKDGFKIKVVV